MPAYYEPPVSRDVLYHNYWDEKLSCSKLATKYGVTSSVIKLWLTKLDIPRRSKRESSTLMWDVDRKRKEKPLKKITKDAPYKNYDTLYHHYWVENLSMPDIAIKYNVCLGTMQHWFRKLKVPTRTISDKVKNAFKNNKYADKYSVKMKVTVKCSWCNKDIEVWNYRTYQSKDFYCSKECRASHWSETRSGENACNWKGGHWGESVSKRCWAVYLVAKKKVLKRDNYTCALCGSRKKLVTHHIIPVKEDIELVFEESNLITLCDNCHVSKVNFHEDEYKKLFTDIVAKVVNSVNTQTV